VLPRETKTTEDAKERPREDLMKKRVMCVLATVIAVSFMVYWNAMALDPLESSDTVGFVIDGDSKGS